jgi:hypothetical protein
LIVSRSRLAELDKESSAGGISPTLRDSFKKQVGD